MQVPHPYVATELDGTDYNENNMFLLNRSRFMVPVPILGNLTLGLTDPGVAFIHPSSDTSVRTVTIPANASVAIGLGALCHFFVQAGAGNLNFSITSDTLRLAGTGTTGARVLAPNGMAVLWKVAATEWVIEGSGLT